MLRHVLHPRAGFADSESDRVELPGCAQRPRHVPRAGSRRARGRCGRHYCSRGLKCQEVAPVSITCSFPVHNVMPLVCTIHKYESTKQHVLVLASACASYKPQIGHAGRSSLEDTNLACLLPMRVWVHLMHCMQSKLSTDQDPHAIH